MTPDVIKALSRESGDLEPPLNQLLTEAKNLIQQSRSKMSTYYSDWDLQDMVFRGERMPDKEDVTQAEKGKPIKMVIPNTHAQCMTFASFLFLMYFQNERLFELKPTSAESYGVAKEDAEILLEHNMRVNEQSRLMFQFLLDIGRFGPSVLEVGWTRKLSKINAPAQPSIVNVQGATITTNPGSEWQDVIKYEGNRVTNLSPYHWLPDCNFPLTDFQKGEFCASEEIFTMAALYELENNGEVAGVDFIRPFPATWQDMRGATTRYNLEINAHYLNEFSSRSKTAPVVVTKMQRWIVPAKYYLDDNKTPLGPETFPVLYHLWYANDQRLIRCEPCGWWHNEFGYTCSQFTPDMNHTLSLGLANLVYRLQDVISWLINARIRDVRRNIFGRNLINQMAIDESSLAGDGDIYLRKGCNIPFDKAIMPMSQNNVTEGHMGDAGTLGSIMQVITGVNDNMLGQYNSGRRAAREVGNVAAGAAGRMKMHGQVIWESGPGRVARLCMSNLRQACSLEEFMAVLGDGNIDILTGQSDINDRYAKFKSTPQRIARGSDYFVYDSSTPSEKGQQAAGLQELLVAIMGNPMAVQTLDVDPKSLLDEISLLRGTGPLQRFSLMAQQMRAQQMQAQANPKFSAFAQ